MPKPRSASDPRGGRISLSFDLMKTLVALTCIGASLSGALGQGLINFFNNSSTLVSYGNVPPYSVLPATTAPSFYFGLLTSPFGAGNFSFAGVYATNQAVAGRFNGGVGVAVPGWAPGTARDFEVVGWSASEGPTFNPAWLTAPFNIKNFPDPFGYIGVSGVGEGVAGGTTSTGTIPSLNLFGGGTGIQSGFILQRVTLSPEPSSLAWAVLGAVAFLIFRRNRGA